MPFPVPKSDERAASTTPKRVFLPRVSAFFASLGIRARIMLAVLLPSLLLTIILCIFFTTLRFKDLEEAYQERGQALLRQLVVACEYPLFSGNQALVLQVLTEVANTDDVIGVAVFNAQGLPMAGLGTLKTPSLAPMTRMSKPVGGVWTLREAVVAGLYPLEELLEGPNAALRAPPLLGYVWLELSTEGLWKRQVQAVWVSFLIFFGLTLVGVVFARFLGESVARPVRSLSRTVQRIGAGSLDERVSIVAGGSLGLLATGVNDMAARLAQAHERMVHKIEEATAQLRASKEEAERSNVAKSRFLAAASHDLRQPMHAMGLFIAALLRQPLSDEARQGVQKVAISAKAMEALLDSLLDISRLDAGILQPHFRDFPIQETFDRLMLHFDEPARLRGVRLLIRPSPLWVYSDPVLLERILSNLLSNALRYAPEGRVWVGARWRNGRVCVQVRDSGIGITPAAQEIIFQEFVQLNPGGSIQPDGHGMGLGLAIVRRMSLLLDHEIGLRSAPGKGSVFECHITASKAPSDQDEHEEDLGEANTTPPCLLLIGPGMPEAPARLLTQWGIAWVTVPDIHSALIHGQTLGEALILILYDRENRPLPQASLQALRVALTPEKPLIILGQPMDSDAAPLSSDNTFVTLKMPLQPARLRALITRFGPG